VFPRIVEIEMRLSGIRMGELSDLEVDDDQRLQPPMRKEQIDAVQLVIDT